MGPRHPVKTMMQSSSFHRFRISQQPLAESALQQKQSGDVRKSSESSNSSARKSSSTSACRRCRRLKKKCSKTLPNCSLCEHAGLPCSLSAAPSVAAVSNVPVDQLQARIAWLSKCLQESLPPEHPLVETISTGSHLSADTLSSSRSPAASSNVVKRSSISSSSSSHQYNITQVLTPESSDAESTSPDHVPTSENVSESARPFGMSVTTAQGTDGDSSKQNSQRMTQEAAGRKFVDAYFQHVHRCYPFINRAEIMEDLEAMGTPGKLETIPSKLYLIMAIGCNTLQRAGRIPCGICVKFQISYLKITQECLSGNDIESVEVLLLLGLYSLFDPSAISPWMTAGILCRQVMLLGLNKKTPPELCLSPLQIELRHRLFWSVFIFDRMVSVSAGLPVGLDDQDIDVPLPSITVEEYASNERANNIVLLQSSRHMITLRRLEGRVLHKIHLTSATASSSLGPSDKLAIVQNLLSEIENWHSQGYLISPAVENDNIAFHNSVSWLNVRYHNLLFLVHSPSNFNSQLSTSQLQELQLSAQNYIRASIVVFSQRRLPLNWITLCRLMTSCAVFWLSYARSDQRRLESREEVLVCANILEEFPATWLAAKQFAGLLRKFAAITNRDPMAEHRQSIVLGLPVPSSTAHLINRNQDHQHHQGAASNGGISSAGDRDMLNDIRAEMKTLLSRVLGESSAYHSILGLGTGTCEVLRYRPLDLTSPLHAGGAATSFGGPLGASAIPPAMPTEMPSQQSVLTAPFDGVFDPAETWSGAFGEFSTDWM